MEVLLLGTGGAAGWPNPWCACSSCTAMRRRGEVRGQTSALVDDVLLLDCGPESPRAAERLGRSLTGVRHVLVTHAHPDHAGGPAALWRQWVEAPAPLDLVGPPAALDVFRPHVGEDDPLTLRPVSAWDVVEVGGYSARAVPAVHGGPDVGPAVLWDLRGPDGARLLWATDTAPLPDDTLDALGDAAFDAVLLECSFGDTPVPGQDHHGLDTWPRTIAELRRRGAVHEGTQLVAVHLNDGNPPPPELDRRFAAWNAVAPPDGTVLRVERGG